MITETNHQILLASRPRGEPTSDNFQLIERAVPKAGPGQMLLRTIYLSRPVHAGSHECRALIRTAG